MSELRYKGSGLRCEVVSDGSVNRIRARDINDRRFRVISDLPLSSKQHDLIQDFLSYPVEAFQRYPSMVYTRLGKTITVWSCSDAR